MAGRDLDRGRLLIPDPVVVTLTRPESPGQGPEESAVVHNVQEQADSQDEVETPMGHGTLDAVTTTFHLWRVECDGLLPANDFNITKHADGTVWKITKVETLAHGRRFRCRCVRKQGPAGEGE